MNDFAQDEQKVAAATPDWRRIPRRLRLLVILLFILVALSFCTLGFLIGRTGYHEHYTGQIVDTITIGSGQSLDKAPGKVYKINIRGRVVYADGTPYRYGKVELRSTPRYTTTDGDGRFEFPDVEPGKHTVSVFRDGTVVAASTITIEREMVLTSTRIVKLEDNTYVILAPLDLPEINLLLRVTQEDGVSFQPGDTRPGEGSSTQPREILEIVLDPNPLPPTPVPAPTPPAPVSPAPIIPTPTPPVPTPPVPVPPAPDPGGGSSGGGGGGSGKRPPTPPPEEAPDIIAGDDLNPTQVWAKLTAVDLFAERAGNFGVKTIGEQNVIIPGSHGSYVFRVKNPEAKELEYAISLSETDENNPRLPMKYRLKQGSGGTDYIGGDAWKSADSVSLGWTPISAGAVAYYTLEWKWAHTNDATDTAIGMQSGAPVYILNIIIAAQFK